MTGGSDGSVRVWSLDSYTPIHRLAAHDNSVTSLQFDDTRIVSGGSDGRVKIWDLSAGTLTRELSQPAEAVWRVAFEEERSVVLASRQGRTVMEVWDFSPPEDLDGHTWSRPLSGVARPDSGGGLVEDAVMEDMMAATASENANQRLRGKGKENRKSSYSETANSSSQGFPAPTASAMERADSEMPDSGN